MIGLNCCDLLLGLGVFGVVIVVWGEVVVFVVVFVFVDLFVDLFVVQDVLCGQVDQVVWCVLFYGCYQVGIVMFCLVVGIVVVFDVVVGLVDDLECMLWFLIECVVFLM